MVDAYDAPAWRGDESAGRCIQTGRGASSVLGTGSGVTAYVDGTAASSKAWSGNCTWPRLGLSPFSRPFSSEPFSFFNLSAQGSDCFSCFVVLPRQVVEQDPPIRCRYSGTASLKDRIAIRVSW